MEPSDDGPMRPPSLGGNPIKLQSQSNTAFNQISIRS